MPFHCFDHTGDIGIEVTADEAGRLFAEAARALTDIITDAGRISVRDTRRLALAAPQLDLLLVDWLGEILYAFDARRWLVSRTEVALMGEAGHWGLDATLHGEPYDPARHPIRLTLKAVTYHLLEVGQRGGLWHARVVFDV